MIALVFAQEVAPPAASMDTWWEFGAVMGLIVVLYAVIDRVIAPLIAARTGGGKKNGNGRNENSAFVFAELNKIIDRHDESYRHRIVALERRLERSEESLNELRNGVSEIGNAVSGAAATLKFLEGKF